MKHKAMYCSDGNPVKSTEILNKELNNGYKITKSFRVKETKKYSAGWRYILEPIINNDKIVEVKEGAEIIPFTIYDYKLFENKLIRRKTFAELSKIISMDGNGVVIFNMRNMRRISYKLLLENFEFHDKKPCGKY